MLVLHYTGMADAGAALRQLCDPAAGVSAHYLVEEDGTVHALVAEDRRAWHAGRGFWRGITDVNSASVGIEIVNPGHAHGYRHFPQAQIDAVVDLARAIVGRHGIRPWDVVGHSDIAPDRKADPGELFPWAELAAAGIGLWPAPADGTGDLARIGYAVLPDPLPARIAFQRRFRPARLDGAADPETLALIAGLDRMLPAGL